MFLGYFTEQPMSAYPEEEARKRGGLTVLTFSNQFFDPDAGSRIYNERMEEYKLADQVGFDGIMINEHHNAPFCMMPEITVWASILAAITERAKIVTLGIPLPVWDNPLMVAEAFAMIDMISKGRLVSGIVRGGGTEQYALNVNPVYNRDRLEEAHDLLIKTWTVPGPFRWEGDHYQFRVVNPWAVPMQKPHPRLWIPGTSSNETIEWAAAHRYPYIGLGTNEERQKRIMSIYTETARSKGYEPGPQNFGQLTSIIAQDTSEKAMKNAEEFDWMAGEFTGLGHPVWSGPTGFLAAARRETQVQRANGRLPFQGMRRQGRGAAKERTEALQARSDDLTLIHGTPGQVIDRIRRLITKTRPGIFLFHSQEGLMNHADSMRCIELLGTQVLPAVREMGAEMGLNSPFDIDAPVSLEFSTDLDLDLARRTLAEMASRR